MRRAAPEAPFDDASSHDVDIPAAATEVLAIPSAIAAHRAPSQPRAPGAPPVVPTVRLGMPNSSMSGPPGHEDPAALDDLRTVAIDAAAVRGARDPFAGEATESFDPHVAAGAVASASDVHGTVRYGPVDGATIPRLDLAHPSEPSAETAPAQPEWFVKGKKVDLPRPPGGAPSVFGDVPSDELAPPPPLAPEDEQATRPTVADVPVATTPTEPRGTSPLVAFLFTALVVAVVVGAGAAVWLGALDPYVPTLRPHAERIDAFLDEHLGVSGVAALLPSDPVDDTPTAPTTTTPTEVTPPPPPEPAPLAVRVDLVNDASGSVFAPLSDPLRDRFLATLLKIKPFTLAKKQVAPRFRFTLFVGGTDVVRDGDTVKSTTTCSLAASDEEAGTPSVLLKASADHAMTQKQARPPPPPKKRMTKKQRAAHEKAVASAERAEEQLLRQVARTAVARCGFELATLFAEKTLAPTTTAVAPEATPPPPAGAPAPPPSGTEAKPESAPTSAPEASAPGAGQP